LVVSFALVFVSLIVLVAVHNLLHLVQTVEPLLVDLFCSRDSILEVDGYLICVSGVIVLSLNSSNTVEVIFGFEFKLVLVTAVLVFR
jgi:hypothetical protein